MKKWAYILAFPALVLYVVLMFTYESWHALDTKMAEWLYGNAAFELFHYFGETKIVISIGIVMMFVFLLRKQSGVVLFIFVAVAGNFGLNQVMKRIVERPRPVIEGQLDSYSFPSGHTMASLTFLLLVAYLVTHYVKKQSTVTMIWLLAILLALATGLSRVAGGRHFMTDVLAGWGLAYAWFALVIFVYETWRRKGK